MLVYFASWTSASDVFILHSANMYVIIVIIIINIIRPHCVHTVHKIWPIGAYVAPLGWYQFILLDDMTYRCKQLAQGCYAAFASSRI